MLPLEVRHSVFSAGGRRSSVETWYTTTLDTEESLSRIVDSNVHIFVSDVGESFDTVDRGVLDDVLGSLGLPAWFQYVYFEYPCPCQDTVFKHSCGLGSLGLGMGAYLKDSSKHCVYFCTCFTVVSLLACFGWC